MASQLGWEAPGCSSAWLERLVWDQEVACSNHVTPTDLQQKASNLMVGGLFVFMQQSFKNDLAWLVEDTKAQQPRKDKN